MKLNSIIFNTLFCSLLLLTSCGSEKKISTRSKLRIPDNAKTVLIIQQSAHLDVDWLMTYDDYFNNVVDRIYTKAIELMLQRRTYIYTVGILAFLKKYYEVHPDSREIIKYLISNGQLRVIGGAFTSPDTNLPSGEAILKDYEEGQRWLRENLTDVNISAAWLPDSFGHTPSVPDLLSYLGIKSVSFARIDGRTQYIDDAIAEVIGSQSLQASDNSTAGWLLNFSSSDFLWVGPGGGEVVAHWMPYNLYCLGGSIDSGIDIPLVNNVLTPGKSNRKFVLKKIEHFINLLKPLSKTGYLFLPIGCDFEMPKDGIDLYVKWWNEEMYPQTHTYAVFGSFQDYGELLWENRDKLPVIPADINPYFMGYYASRPYIKDTARENLYLLLNVEFLNVLNYFFSDSPLSNSKRDDLWWKNSFVNHHDFITGTSPDTVYEAEQKGWLDNLNLELRDLNQHYLREITKITEVFPSVSTNESIVFNTSGVTSTFTGIINISSKNAPVTSFKSITYKKDGQSYSVPVQYEYSYEITQGEYINYYQAAVEDIPPLGFKKLNFSENEANYPLTVSFYLSGGLVDKNSTFDEIIISNNYFTVIFTNSPYWSIKSIKDKSGKEFLDDNSFYPLIYYDEGGPWELGNEMEGCNFSFLSFPSSTATVNVSESEVYAKVQISYENPDIETIFRFYSNLDSFEVEIKGATIENTTVTLVAKMKGPLESGLFSVPFGYVERPQKKIFNPTFWPSSEWTAFENGEEGFLFLNRGIQSWHYNENGEIEFVVLRNVSIEKCRLLTVPTFKASSSESTTRFLKVYPYSGNIDVVDAWRKAIAYNFSDIVFLNSSDYSTDLDEGSFLTVGGEGVLSSFTEENGYYKARLFFPLFSEGKNRGIIKISEKLKVKSVKNFKGEKAGKVSCKGRVCEIRAYYPIISVYLSKK